MARRASNFVDILSQPYRWPKAGDRLFAPASGGDAAEIPGDAHTRLQLMTNGYKEGADIHADIAIADPAARHVLIYPIIFGYRHYIELTLKGMVGFYGARVHVTVPKKAPPHDLKQLLKAFRRTLRAYHVTEPQGADINVSKCILDFDRFDPQSFNFRYATAKDGKAYPIRLSAIDLPRLRETMDGVQNYFEGTDAYLFNLVSSTPY